MCFCRCALRYGSAKAISSPGRSSQPTRDDDVLFAVQHVGHRRAGGVPHPLLKFSGGSVDDYATISDESPRPS